MEVTLYCIPDGYLEEEDPLFSIGLYQATATKTEYGYKIMSAYDPQGDRTGFYDQNTVDAESMMIGRDKFYFDEWEAHQELMRRAELLLASMRARLQKVQDKYDSYLSTINEGRK